MVFWVFAVLWWPDGKFWSPGLNSAPFVVAKFEKEILS